MRRVAVVGSGIAGLACANALADVARVTLFEAGQHFGGHTHTVDVTLDGVRCGVDTGFLVFNHRTYPNLVQLFKRLQVETAPSEMSFSVQLPRQGGPGLEWSGCSLNSVFAQRRNLLRPRFLGMLADLLRFNRLTTALAEAGSEAELDEPLADFLQRQRFGATFREAYLLPMLGCIWSCPTAQMLQFPVATMIRFCHNHGLLQIRQRPQWYTVRGGARHYVAKLLQGLDDARLHTPVLALRRRPPGAGGAGVTLSTAQGSEVFDDVVLACHSDQSLALLQDADAAEREVLGAIRFQPNQAVLHTDASLLPRRRLAWAAWNYEGARSAQAAEDASEAGAGREPAAVCLHYLLNRLQPLPWQRPLMVSLNPQRQPDAAQVLGRYTFSHPLFDRAAIAAQRRLPQLQGRSHVWFAGAWTGYGFHEDGLVSALQVAADLRASWATQPSLEQVA